VQAGGQILHVLPANNFCGHGFWQFSPELFFSLYSAENGYAETTVLLAELPSSRSWYEVQMPHDGLRVNVRSTAALYVLVRTKRTSDPFSHAQVQQSDYVRAWSDTAPAKTFEPTLAMKLKGAIVASPLAPVARRAARGLDRWSYGLRPLGRKDRDLVRRSTSSLL